MELIYFEKYLKHHQKDPLVVAIGQFDGIHLAHRELLEQTVAYAKDKKVKSAVLTFDPHPDFILKTNIDQTYLTPITDKAKSIATLGIDYMIVIRFNKMVASTSPEDFVNNYLMAINTVQVVVGFDFCFGQYGKGKPNMIRNLSNNIIDVHVVDEIKYQNEKIGSTKVRELLLKGQMDEVKNLLGHHYAIEGKVLTGRKVGRTLNAPTANLIPKSEYAKVKQGVYAVVVTYHNQKYMGIANYGHNPSFNYKEQMTLEVHILDFNEDIYGENLGVSFVDYLRPEVQFATKADFIKQIEADTLKARQVLEPYL